MTESEQTPELAAAEKALLAELAADSGSEKVSALTFAEFMAEQQEKLLTASQTALGYRKALTEEWGETTALQLSVHALSSWQSYILRGQI